MLAVVVLCGTAVLALGALVGVESWRSATNRDELDDALVGGRGDDRTACDVGDDDLSEPVDTVPSSDGGVDVIVGGTGDDTIKGEPRDPSGQAKQRDVVDDLSR